MRIATAPQTTEGLVEAFGSAPAPGLSSLDVLVLLAYALAVLAIGYFAGRGQKGSLDLHLGGRRIPVWAAFLSMVATELSAATFIGVPAHGYAQNWDYLQLAFGALLGKVVLARTFLPRYRALNVVTVYGFLGMRYGRWTQQIAAFYFLLGRLLASGVRLFIGALAFATATGFSVEAAILLAGLVGATYTLFGGIRAVVWTDTLQGLLFMVAALSSLVFFALRLEGGLLAGYEVATAAGKTQIFSWPSLFTEGTKSAEVWADLARVWSRFVAGYLTNNGAFPTAALFGFVLVLATHGTDQDMVQRLLTTRDTKGSARALIGSGLSNFPLTFLFLALGTGLWAFYEGGLGAPATAGLPPKDQVFPFFVLHEMPSGLRGLIFAGLFAAAMSSLDSTLNALASTWSVDFRSRHLTATDLANEERDQASSSRAVLEMRLAILVFAALLIASALLFVVLRRQGESGGQGLSLVTFALTAMNTVYGALLGVFAVGMFSRRGTEGSARVGLLIGGALGLLLFLQPQWLPLFHPEGAAAPPLLVTGFLQMPLAAVLTALVVLCRPGRGVPTVPAND